MIATSCVADSLRVGAAFVTITPPLGIAMQGYGIRYAEGINDPLFASALAAGDDRLSWLLLSVDSIGLDRSFTNRLRTALASRFELAPSAITIACSHTHSGPATLAELGPVAADAAYLVSLEKRLATVAAMAVEKREPARWRFGVASLAENVNRRLRRDGKIEFAVNSNGPADSRLRVIRIDRTARSPQEPPLALIIHYACHPTSSSDVTRISADWPGVMRSVLRRVYGENGEPPIICFLQGCTGDLTHRIARDRTAWPEHFGAHTSLQSQILGRLAASAALTASERSVDLSAENISTTVEGLTLPFSGCSGFEEAELQVIRIGPLTGKTASAREAVWIIGLPGEPFTEYSTGLGQLFDRRLGAPSDRVLVCGYTNDCVGYFCTPGALRQGGYEAEVAHQMYHRPSSFSAATQSLVFDRALTGAGKLIDNPSMRQSSLFAATLKGLSQWRLLRT
jgi:neutral ceramidase